MNVFKFQMESRHCIDEIDGLITRILLDECAHHCGYSFRSRTDVSAHAHVLPCFAKPYRNAIINIANEHFMQQQNCLFIYCEHFSFLTNVLHHGCEIFCLEYFSHRDLARDFQLEKGQKNDRLFLVRE